MIKERKIGRVPPTFIVPGVDQAYPGSGLHVRATEQTIEIFPMGTPFSKYIAIAHVGYSGSMSADLRTRDSLRGPRKLEVYGREFLRFAIEYFDLYAQSPPSEFTGKWYPKRSVNFTQYKKAMRGRPDTQEARVAAVATTWTAYALQEHFIPRSVAWTGSFLYVWFSRK